MIWNLEEEKESHFVPRFLTWATEQGHMGEGASVGRKKMGDPSGDVEKTVDSVQWTRAQGSSWNWRVSPWKDMVPGEEISVQWGEKKAQDRPEEH